MRSLIQRGPECGAPFSVAPLLGCFERGLKFVLDHEGGWSDDPRDPGGATMRGVTLGTYTAWRHSKGLSTPTKEELRNISEQEVRDIYYKNYYLRSGADKLPFPLCMAHFDLAVNGGVGRAQEALKASGGDVTAYNDWREAWYRRIPNFDIYGNGWLNRVNDLRKAISDG